MAMSVSRQLARAALLVCLAHSAAARADDIPDIVISADRTEEPVSRTGASVTVIPAKDIEKLGTKGVADVLRDVAGVNVTETGGVGGATTVRLRGAAAGDTLVLIDGVRVGDSTSVDDSVDFGNLSAVDIERIEVLRGPQSALYGSDAMGGVVNIITRKGRKTPVRTITVEGGSYGTLSTRATLAGGDDNWTYSLGVNALHSDGFPRYGYRVNRPLFLPDGVTPLPALPADDPANKGGVAGRFSYRLTDTASIDAGFSVFGNALRFDNPFTYTPSNVFGPYNSSTALIADGFVRANFDTPNGVLHNQLTVFGNSMTRNIWETDGCYNASFLSFNCRSGYVGQRLGAEYQGDVKMGPLGSLIVGARTETETARTNQSPDPNDGSFTPIHAQQTTNSIFAEHKITLGQRLDLSVGARLDSIEGGEDFGTWRATAAYRIDETGTKFRGSVATGAKAATLYQRFSPYGTPGLQPERSTGYDIGVDQSVLDGRLTLSATAFETRYRDLINFADVAGCSLSALIAGGGCYYNVGLATARGLELSGDANLVPSILRAKATYTYLRALDQGSNPTDIDAGLQLYRLPRNQGSLSLIYTGIDRLEIEPRLTFVGPRLDAAYLGFTPVNVTLAGYTKVDLLAP